MPDINFQKIVLNLIPKQGEQPVVFYASQYETKRQFIADLMWGDSEYAPGPDCWAEIDIRKNDDNLVVITDDVTIDNNEVSVILPVQAVTCIGKNLGQIKIYSGEDQFVAAFNFILEVQPDPLAGGVTSETAIDNLESQIEDIATEVIGEDYYNKTETDALLADKADKSELPDMTDYYTKTQTDNLLNDKADRSDLATLASKAEVTQAISDEDTAVKNWVSSNFATPGYVASHYYSKLQVDDIINNMLPVGSASGNPCTFDTEIPAELQALTANIVCGGGGGTPSTPIPLVGHSSINLDVNGNTFTVQFGQTVYGGVYDKSGRLTINHSTADEDTFTNYDGQTSPGGLHWVSATVDNVRNGHAVASMLEVKNTDEGWVSTTPCLTMENGRLIIYTDKTSLADFKTYYDGLQIVYELATPIVIDVQAISPSAVVGTNNIISDCNGDVNVSYKDSIQHYIDTRG